MARIRTFKPEFWTDEIVAAVSRDARLLFLGSWSFADDYGHLDRSSKQLKAQVFPHDVIDVEPLLQELLAFQLLREYRVDGKAYLEIRGFQRHQRIEKRSAARHPFPGQEATAPGGLADYSGPMRGVVTVLRDGKVSKN